MPPDEESTDSNEQPSKEERAEQLNRSKWERKGDTDEVDPERVKDLNRGRRPWE